MKKALNIFLPVCLCLLLAVFLPSCSDSQDNLIDTSKETLTAEETYATSGICNDTVEWRYDASTSTFCFFGTGKVTFGHIKKDMSHWISTAEKVRFEEGITDAEYSRLTEDVIKTRITIDELELEYLHKYKKVLSPKKIYDIQRAEMKFSRELLKGAGKHNK